MSQELLDVSQNHGREWSGENPASKTEVTEGALPRRLPAMGIYPVEPLLLTLELRECYQNLGAMTTWINTRPDLGDFSVGTH